MAQTYEEQEAARDAAYEARWFTSVCNDRPEFERDYDDDDGDGEDELPGLNSFDAAMYGRFA